MRLTLLSPLRSALPLQVDGLGLGEGLGLIDGDGLGEGDGDGVGGGVGFCPPNSKAPEVGAEVVRLVPEKS